MQHEYIIPLNMLDETREEEVNYIIVLNAEKKIIWANDNAAHFFQSDLNIENHLDPTIISAWYSYLNKIKDATVKKSFVTLLDKNKQLIYFEANGLFNHWNQTYMIIFQPLKDQLSSFGLYHKTFKLLDDMQMGAFISQVNGFIFSANETAKNLVPTACQMSNEELLRHFLNDEEFGHYIKLLNKRESFSVDVICRMTNKNYQLMHRFDHEFKLHFITIQPMLLKEVAIQQEGVEAYLDKETAASIVHEIRNPLTIIQGFLDLIGLDDTKNRQYLQLLGNELQRMEVLLGGMLQYLKPKVQSGPIECNQFLQKILLFFEMEIKEHNICLIYSQASKPCYIMGNELGLTQVFINLIKNSIDAMENNGAIVITLKEGIDNELEICIKDTGNGMNDEQLKNLFVPYYTTKKKGTGLGLPIVKKLIEDMNGRITVRSKPGEGTEVCIFLKLAESCDCNFTNCANSC